MPDDGFGPLASTYVIFCKPDQKRRQGMMCGEVSCNSHNGAWHHRVALGRTIAGVPGYVSRRVSPSEPVRRVRSWRWRRDLRALAAEQSRAWNKPKGDWEGIILLFVICRSGAVTEGDDLQGERKRPPRRLFGRISRWKADATAPKPEGVAAGRGSAAAMSVPCRGRETKAHRMRSAATV